NMAVHLDGSYHSRLLLKHEEHEDSQDGKMDESRRKLPVIDMVGEPRDAEAKEERLGAILRGMGSGIVGLSGGVDRAYLSYVASRELGDRALSITGDSPSYPSHQKAETVEFTKLFNIKHEIIATEEIESEDYRKNAPNRCYYCKNELFTKLTEIAG